MPRYDLQRRLCSGIGALLLSVGARGQSNGADSTAILKDFANRVGAYMKIHKMAEAELHGLKPTASKEEIDRHQHAMARRIREERSDAGRGNIFTADIAGEFRRTIGVEFAGPDGARIRESLRSGTHVPAEALRVNGSYPEGLPLQTTPPSLLQNLAPLPKGLEYRVVGHDLVILDAEANLIVDILPGAIP